MKKDYPKVSVVTITYGHENYIIETIKGVLMQMYSGEIEFIIANDNSPDETDKTIADYFSGIIIPKNISVKYTKHKINKGAPFNFSWALEQASGKYIALCEGDDYWIDPFKLQKQVKFLEQNQEYTLCFTAKTNIDDKGVLISEARYGHRKTWSAQDVLDGGFIVGLQTIVSRNLSKEFNEFCSKFPNRTGADRLYTYFYGIKGKLMYIDDNTAKYRIHEGGIWSTLSEKEKIVAHFTQHLKFLEVIKKNARHYMQLKKNMFRFAIKNEYFKFFAEPSKTTKNLIFIMKKYKLSPTIFLLAGKDFVTYYIEIVEKKFK